jgi:hypothetical protein
MLDRPRKDKQGRVLQWNASEATYMDGESDQNYREKETEYSPFLLLSLKHWVNELSSKKKRERKQGNEPVARTTKAPKKQPR